MKQTFILAFILFMAQSCSNITSSKINRKFSNNIARNIKYLGPDLLHKYHSNSSVKVDTIPDQTLKQELRNLQIEYFVVLYKFDSSYLKPYQVQFINPNNSDSIIIFGKFKNTQNFSLSSWNATFEVDYFFGKLKPDLQNFKDEFHDITKKINDSMYFTRTNFPDH